MKHSDTLDWYFQNLRTQRAQISFDRYALLTPLRILGVTQIEARYDGMGDAGNIDDIILAPGHVTPSDAFSERLRDFLWMVLTNLHPGFEIHDGGFGKLVWTLGDDAILLEHNERYTDYTTTLHQGL